MGMKKLKDHDRRECTYIPGIPKNEIRDKREVKDIKDMRF